MTPVKVGLGAAALGTAVSTGVNLARAEGSDGTYDRARIARERVVQEEAAAIGVLCSTALLLGARHTPTAGALAAGLSVGAFVGPWASFATLVMTDRISFPD